MYDNNLTCAICGEPWDAHGVKTDGTGEMKGWEAELFLKGAGCPGCEGETPEGIDRRASEDCRSRENGN